MNNGRFKKGYDSRRHRFSTEECRAGGIMTQTYLRITAPESYFSTDEELTQYICQQRLRLHEIGYSRKTFRYHPPMISF